MLSSVVQIGVVNLADTSDGIGWPCPLMGV